MRTTLYSEHFNFANGVWIRERVHFITHSSTYIHVSTEYNYILSHTTLATSVECSDGDVQLVSGASESEGRLQVCMGGLWGTVCDGDGTWGTEEAAVVCQQLGYSSQGQIL